MLILAGRAGRRIPRPGHRLANGAPGKGGTSGVLDASRLPLKKNVPEGNFQGVAGRAGEAAAVRVKGGGVQDEKRT